MSSTMLQRGGGSSPSLGSNRSDWRHRLLVHHLPIFLAAVVLMLVFLPLSAAGRSGPPDMANMSGHGGSASSLWKFFALATTATGWVATIFLAVTLLIGPANLLLRRRNPVSSYLRRDVGAWTAVVSLLHVVLGLQVHGRVGDLLNFVRYFVTGEGQLRTDSFGLGNWTGLAATVIVVGLLAISTDRSIRELKSKRWKSVQRLNYALFVLVVLHAVFYGALQRGTTPFAIVLIGIVTVVLVGQLIGIRLWRRKLVQTTTRRSQQVGVASQGEDAG